MHWLVSQSSCMLTSLFLECVVTLGLSPVWVQVQVQVQVQVLLQVYLLQLLHFPPFFLKIQNQTRGSIQFCLDNKITWYFIDRIVPDIVSFLIKNMWRMKLSFLVFCQMAVFSCWISDVGASDLQHTPGSSVYLGLIITILLHNPVGV